MQSVKGERAVSELFGALLVFGLLVLLLVLAQVTLVPTLNQQVEYEHSIRVGDDLQDLQTALTRVSASGAPESVSVETGVVYPSRPLLINPGPVQGVVSTAAAGDLVISNVTTSNPETADFWNGTRDGHFETRAVTYEAQYNEYRSPGSVVLENGIIYRRIDTTNVVTGDQMPLIEDNRISVVTVIGDLSEADGSTTSLAVTPTSAPARTMAITNASGDITLQVPTTLGQSEWDELLDGEARVKSHVVSGGVLTLVLEPGTYELRLSQVKLGPTNPVAKTPAYLTRDRGSAAFVPIGGGEVSVDVRDQFNNPVSNVDVTFTTTIAGITFAETGTDTAVAVSDETGRATVPVVATDDVTVPVRATIPPTGLSGDDADANGKVDFEEVRFDVQVGSGSDNGGAGTGADFDQINPNEAGRLVLMESFSSCDPNNCPVASSRVVMVFENKVNSSVTVDSIRINSYQANRQGASKEDFPAFATLLNSSDGSEFSLPVIEVRGTAQSVNTRLPTVDPSAVDYEIGLRLYIDDDLDETLSGGDVPYQMPSGESMLVTVEYSYFNATGIRIPLTSTYLLTPYDAGTSPLVSPSLVGDVPAVARPRLIATTAGR